MQAERSPFTGNRFDLSEWAGAFGDLGTLIPFVVGYLTITKMDPLGVLATLGVLLIVVGVVYRTPMPVQPMKAIGAAAIAGGAAITPGMVWVAGLFTGAFWLLMGLIGKLHVISGIASKPVLRGIMLALGLRFILDGTQMMQTDWIVGAIAFAGTLLLLSRGRIPAMLVLLVFGIAVAVVRDPELLGQLAAIRPDLRLPEFTLTSIARTDILTGILVLAIPQIPLTFGNAVIATTEENNRHFPERPVTENRLAASMGLVNLFSPLFGGIPLCHGAGGMAGHIRFGAQTGGASVIIGSILLVLGLFFSDSVVLLFGMFPAAVIGVILMFAGLELALTARDVGSDRSDFYLLLITTAFCLWNIGAGFAIGLAVQWLMKRKVLWF